MVSKRGESDKIEMIAVSPQARPVSHGGITKANEEIPQELSEFLKILYNSDIRPIENLMRLNDFIYGRKKSPAKLIDMAMLPWLACLISETVSWQIKSEVRAEMIPFFCELCLIELEDKEMACKIIKKYHSHLIATLGEAQSRMIALKDGGDLTPLHYLAISNNYLAIKELVPGPFESREQESVTKMQKQTPLHYAAKAGSLETVKYLVNELKCDVRLKDAFGRSAFFLAAQNGCYGCTDFFMDHGCRLDETDNSNQSVCYWIIRKLPATLALKALSKWKNEASYENNFTEPSDKYNETILSLIVSAKADYLCTHLAIRDYVEYKWKQRSGRFKGFFVANLLSAILIIAYAVAEIKEKAVLFALLIALGLYMIQDICEFLCYLRVNKYMSNSKKSRQCQCQRMKDENRLHTFITINEEKLPRIKSDSYQLLVLLRVVSIIIFAFVIYGVWRELSSDESGRLAKGPGLLFTMLFTSVKCLWSLGLLFETLGTFLGIIERQALKILGWILLFLLVLLQFTIGFYSVFSGTKYVDKFKPLLNGCPLEPLEYDAVSLNQTFTDSNNQTWNATQLELCSNNYVKVEGMDTRYDAGLTLFMFTFGNELDYKNMTKVGPVMSIILIASYLLITVIIFLNILIAIFTEAYSSTKIESGGIITMRRAEKIYKQDYENQIKKLAKNGKNKVNIT